LKKCKINDKQTSQCVKITIVLNLKGKSLVLQGTRILKLELVCKHISNTIAISIVYYIIVSTIVPIVGITQ